MTIEWEQSWMTIEWEQSWMTIKKTEIEAQQEFLKPIYPGAYRVTILKYLGVYEKC